MTNPNMNGNPVIEFENASKAYRLGRRTGGRTLKEAVLRGPSRKERKWFHALKDFSMSIHEGEVVGLVGDNGSGKSTVLKAVAGIIEPTSGTVRTKGRVSALLEIGAGFHPEMTGRENVFLSGTILGIDRAELEARYDSIVAFAELEEFMNTPVKFYSSGMYLRLGFAIAMNVDPDVLLVDEVFSVGDNVFQARCKQELRKFRKAGKTILFVSHDMTVVQSFCTRAVYLDHGSLVADGPTDAVVFQYERHIQERRRELEQKGLIYSLRYHNRDGSQIVRITGVRILDENGEEKKEFEIGESLTFEVHFENAGFEEPVIFNFAVSDVARNMLFIGSTRQDELPIPRLPKEGVMRVTLPNPALTAGVYFLSFGFFDSGVDFDALDFRNHVLDLQKFKYSFIVRRTGLAWKSGGGIFMRRSWRLEDNGKVIGEAKE